MKGDVDWRQLGACGNHNPDWWTPASAESLEAQTAVAICLDCPVQRQCRDYARHHPQLCAGAIYGGIYYTVGGGVSRTIRPSLLQPKPRTAKKAA